MTKKLGTFMGVYMPTVLTILGVIMYLRLGWVTGQLGLAQTLLVVGLANAITLITAFSFSSVATNTTVGIGGAYYIISRSLGAELGGAIGIPLFLAQTLSTTLYAFGLAETLQIFWPAAPLQITAAVVVLGVALLAFAGPALALRVQIPVLVAVAVSLAALAAGAVAGGERAVGLQGPTGEIGLWMGFAVFFPAVTGIMAGLGLSGDLRDPGKAIPRGAILAVLTGLGVYLLVPVLLTLSASATELREDPLVWTRVAPGGAWIIVPGLLGAIFSSAIGSILGAPRTLQALSLDRLVPRGFAGGRDSSPRALLPGFALTVGLAMGAVTLGDLNAVASLVTMFFLTVYGMVNVAAAFETLSGDPSWRPRIRVPWPVSLLGGLGCAAVMFMIQPWAGLLAVVFEAALYLALARRSRRARWGDARRGLYESLVRWALIRLARRPFSARNWRPHALVFVQDPQEEIDLIRFGDWFSQGRGIVTVCQLVVGDILREDFERHARLRRMKEILHANRLMVFPEVDVVDDVIEGFTDVAQSNGIAGLESNTVMLGWPDRRENLVEFVHILRRMEKLQKSVLLGRVRGLEPMRRGGPVPEIHVWWGGLQRNGDLMLLLAYLLKLNHRWREARVKVISIATTELMHQRTEAYLAGLLERIRIEADVQVLPKPRDRRITDLIHETSREAAVVFLGLAVPDEGEEESYAARLESLAGELRAVFFVKNSSIFGGDLLEDEKAVVADTPENDDEEDGEDDDRGAAPPERAPGRAPLPADRPRPADDPPPRS